MLDASTINQTLSQYLTSLSGERFWLHGDVVGSWRLHKAAESLQRGASLEEALSPPHLSSLERLVLWESCLSPPLRKKAETPWYRNPWLGAALGLGGGLLADRMLFSSDSGEQSDEDLDPVEEKSWFSSSWPWLRSLSLGLGGAALGYGGLSALNRMRPQAPSPQLGSPLETVLTTRPSPQTVSVQSMTETNPLSNALELNKPIDPLFTPPQLPDMARWPVLGLEWITDLMRKDYAARGLPWEVPEWRLPDSEEMLRLIADLNASLSLAYDLQPNPTLEYSQNVPRDTLKYVLSRLAELPRRKVTLPGGQSEDFVERAKVVLQDELNRLWPQIAQRIRNSSLNGAEEYDEEIVKRFMEESIQNSVDALGKLLDYRDSILNWQPRLPAMPSEPVPGDYLPEVLTKLQAEVSRATEAWNPQNLLPSDAKDWQSYPGYVRNWLVPVKLYDLALKRRALLNWSDHLFEILESPRRKELKEIEEGLRKIEQTKAFGVDLGYLGHPDKLQVEDLMKQVPVHLRPAFTDLLNAYRRLYYRKEKLWKELKEVLRAKRNISSAADQRVAREVLNMSLGARFFVPKDLSLPEMWQYMDLEAIPPHFYLEYFLGPSRNPWANLADEQHPGFQKWFGNRWSRLLNMSADMRRRSRAMENSRQSMTQQ